MDNVSDLSYLGSAIRLISRLSGLFTGLFYIIRIMVVGYVFLNSFIFS